MYAVRLSQEDCQGTILLRLMKVTVSDDNLAVRGSLLSNNILILFRSNVVTAECWWHCLFDCVGEKPRGYTVILLVNDFGCPSSEMPISVVSLVCRKKPAACGPEASTHTIYRLP